MNSPLEPDKSFNKSLRLSYIDSLPKSAEAKKSPFGQKVFNFSLRDRALLDPIQRGPKAGSMKLDDEFAGAKFRRPSIIPSLENTRFEETNHAKNDHSTGSDSDAEEEEEEMPMLKDILLKKRNLTATIK
mgnify:CR=1 FL=1